MKKLKHIDIVFENCEVIQVPATCIYYLGLVNVTNNKSMHINRHNKTDIEDYLKAKEVYLYIYDSPDIKNVTGWSEENENCIERIIKHSDICNLDLIYEDDTNEYISVPWGDAEYKNEYQVNEIQEFYGKQILKISIVEK